MIGRRELITLLGGAAAWPVAARAQQPAMPVVGFLNAASANSYPYLAAAFRQGLGEYGYAESRNVAIEYRWADNRYDRLPALAADLVHRRSSVSWPHARATGPYPIARRLPPSAEPSGSSRYDPVGPSSTAMTHPLRSTGITPLQRYYEAVLDEGFAALTKSVAQGLIVLTDPILFSERKRIVELANQRRLPGMYFFQEFVKEGGLVSYGPSDADLFRRSAAYVDRILKGTRPSDLPVEQPTKFDLAINLKTARALGLEVPPALLARADEVIE
jgi:putative tryptophan/tyrosine transport system substrate-binding protein